MCSSLKHQGSSHHLAPVQCALHGLGVYRTMSCQSLRDTEKTQAHIAAHLACHLRWLLRGHRVCCDGLPLQAEQQQKPERKTTCCPLGKECRLWLKVFLFFLLHARLHACMFAAAERVWCPKKSDARLFKKAASHCLSPWLCLCAPPAIRFGRMPQAEKLKLKAESKMVEKEVASPMLADHKVLVRQIHEAYMKNFNMNKAKARLILTGKTSTQVETKKPREAETLFRVLTLSLVLLLSSPSSLSSFTTWRRSSWPRGR